MDLRLNPVPDKAVRYLSPYRDTANLYRVAGWRGPIPLPYKEKHPPPTGWTGHAAPYPTDDHIRDWTNEGQRNIGIRLAGVDDENEIIGIDVDHYHSGDKVKKGGDQLEVLENRLGPLPATWISSARKDGISGIRYFRVPRGMAFRGQVDKDIECIQKGHRFAVVFPSIHPNGSRYEWYRPGVRPLGLTDDSHDQGQLQLPDARKLPFLPKKWLEHLTNGGMEAGEHEQLDMSINVDEIYEWADSTFHQIADEDFICSKLREKLDGQKKDIESEATSHDKIRKAHWNIFRLAAEGHLGWVAAVNEIDKFYLDDVIARDKRGFDEVRGEIFRSRTNALRKIKVQIDNRVAIGAAPVDSRCDVTGVCGSPEGTDGGPDGPPTGPPDDPLNDVPRGPIRPVDEYEMNDDGNAEHFRDQFSSIADGPAVRFVDGYGWIIWHNGDAAHQPHWELDREGDQEVRRMWQRVKQRQLAYVDVLLQDYEQIVQNNIGVTPVPAVVKAAKAKYERWRNFAQLSGNNKNAENALKAVRSLPGVAMDINELDGSKFLMGVANGVLELGVDGVRLRRAAVQDYITLNTGTPFEEPSTFAKAKWQEYLDTFIPDENLQKTTQVALGHTILGGNPEKILIVLKGAPNTGKSTMVNAIEAAMGEYAQSVSQTIFQNHKLNPVLANAVKKRIIVCSEFDDQDSLSASMIKRLTGGSDKIQAELKGSNVTVEAVPQFVPVLATNSVPSISGADKALKNRLYVIPFNTVPTVIKKHAADALTTVCGPAVLQWLVDGYEEYQRLGSLPTAQAILDEIEEFASELDPISTFDYLNLSTDHKEEEVMNHIMWERFGIWWRSQGYRDNMKPSQPAFTRRLTALGHKLSKNQKRLNGIKDRVWTGVSLKELDTGATVYSIADATKNLRNDK